MNARDEKLIEAALSVFARYGVSKATMNDIAREAGVARQTLYNAYPGKEAILRATVKTAGTADLHAVLKAWEDAPSLGEKLDLYFALGPLKWYDLVQSSPEAADLIDGIHNIAREESEALGRQWTAEFAKLIRASVPEGSAAWAGADATADFIYATSINAKMQAPDRDRVVQRLAILKTAILALLPD